MFSSICDFTLIRTCDILAVTVCHGCGVGGVGEWGIEEGGADRIIRNGSRDGLVVSVAFRSMVCPFLYTVKVTLSPTDLC